MGAAMATPDPAGWFGALQAAWYDLRVRIEKVAAEEGLSEPQFAVLPVPPHLPRRPDVLGYGAEFRTPPRGNRP